MEMNDIMKTIKFLEELIKDISKTIKNKAKEQKELFLGMLLGTLGATLLIWNVLTGKGTIRATEGTIRAGLCF